MTADRFANDLAPHYNEALSYCRALCASWSPSQAEDVLHSALLKALEHYGELRDREKFKPWLFQIITRTFYSAVRRAFWRRFIPISDAPEVKRMQDVYHRPERQDNQWLLFEALSHLSKKQRAAVLLFHVAGFSIEEIAAIQNECSLSTVKSRLSRARRKLRTRLRELAEDELEEEEQDLSRSNGLNKKARGSNHETSRIQAGVGEPKRGS